MSTYSLLHSQLYVALVTFDFFLTILLASILTQISGKLGTRSETLLLRSIISCAIVATLMEALYNLVIGRFLILSIPMIILINLLDLLAVPTCVYLWFRFCNLRVRSHPFDEGAISLVAKLLLVVLYLLDATSFKTGWIFHIDESGVYTRGPYFWFQFATCYIYCALGLITCTYGILRGAASERDMAIRTFLYGFLPVLAGFLHLINGNISFTMSSITLMIFFLFISLQGQRIYTDAMTMLNNKLRTVQYVEQRIRTANETPFILYMIDVNLFKKINDNFGHVAGDKALILVADSIKTLTDEYSGFAGRYGGDEFCIITDAAKIDDKDGIETQLNIAIEKNAKIAKLRFPITLTAGFTVCDSPDDAIQEVFQRADEMLYERKRARKQARQ